MGKVIIQEETTLKPVTLIGKEAGICWGANTEDDKKNYKRGMDCILSGHGRTMEYPQIYMVLEGYSARVIRELYTHIAGGPTRLQASTRYIDYSKNGGFEYIIPPQIKNNEEASKKYVEAMKYINDVCASLEHDYNIPREDAAMLLPLGMTSKIVLRTNLRNLIDMAHQRLCTRAYWEFRQLMTDIIDALVEYGSASDVNEWEQLKKFFVPKCEVVGFCIEAKCCGRKPQKRDM